MAAVTWTVRDAFLLIPLVVGAVTYLGMILILRAIPKEDWDSLIKLGSPCFIACAGAPLRLPS